jgi:phasin family protein
MSKQNSAFNNMFNIKDLKDLKDMFDISKLNEMASRNYENLQAANQVVAAGMQAVMRRNAMAWQENAKQGFEYAKNAMNVNSLEEAQASSMKFASNMMNSLLNNVRENAEVSSKATQELVDMCNKNFSELANEVKKWQNQK